FCTSLEVNRLLRCSNNWDGKHKSCVIHTASLNHGQCVARIETGGNMKSVLSVCVALSLATCLAACSVYMETTRPTPVDLNGSVATLKTVTEDLLQSPSSRGG